jgi:RNA-directed DNA polymerase
LPDHKPEAENKGQESLAEIRRSDGCSREISLGGNMLEKILNRRNIERAISAVERNGGAGGVDDQQSDELRPFVNANCQRLVNSIADGSYQPSPVRKVEIPKATGGMRMLGIPTVLDRMIQQAIYQVLSPVYEEDFDKNSYGFRRGKNAHQAVLKAQVYLNEGYNWIIELDLEKFFDKVNHQKLMHLLSQKVKDRSTLLLINSYLKTGIMEGGLVSQRTEGTPQGSPLSPLLSNIVLHELDMELNKRGHRFVRYADDCSIYVKSKKSAERVKESIIKFLEGELLLKVNREKTRVSRAHESYLLGFSFYQMKGRYEIRISPKSVNRVKTKCKEITRSSDPKSESLKLTKLNELIRGWVNYFKIANAKSTMAKLDELVRSRLRISTWRRWKRIRTRITNLLKLGVAKSKAYMWGNTSKGASRVAHSPILTRTLDMKYFRQRGYVGFYTYWQADRVPTLF